MMKLTIETGKHQQGREHIIYGELRDENGSLVISATLGYILVAIRERGHQVEGVGFIDPLYEED